MKLNIVVQDKRGNLTEELIVDVSDDITKSGLVDALRDENVISSSQYQVYIPLGDSDNLLSPTLQEGSTVVIQEHKSTVRIIERGNRD